MNVPTLTHDPKALELQARSLEALVSLLHALNASNDVDDVAKRALLTVSGQMLVRRAALFVNEEGVLNLRASVGIPRRKIAPRRWTFAPYLESALAASEDGVVEITRDEGAPESRLAESFDRLALLTNGSEMIGVLTLGGWLGSTTLSEADRQLLRTMGVVIGTTLHRVAIHEQLVRARERLEQAHLVRQGVMDHVSHEFNTPLMVVKSVGGLLRQAGERDRDELLDMHDDSVSRLEHLVESILCAAHDIEGESQVTQVSLVALVEEILRPWALRYVEAVFHHGVDGDESTFVEVDTPRLETILGALRKNAREAGRDVKVWVNAYEAPVGWWETQDHVTRLAHYRTQRPSVAGSISHLGIEVPVPEGTSDREVVIEMVDLGRGIPENDLEQVFDAFSLASNSPKRGISGAGMGLTMAQRIADDLTGRIAIRSREDEGTVVALILPAWWDDQA